MGRVKKSAAPAEPKIAYQPGQRPTPKPREKTGDEMVRASSRATAIRELDALLDRADFEERMGTPRAAANDGVRERFLELLEEVGTMTDAYEKAQADLDEKTEDLKAEEASKEELQKEYDTLANDLAAAKAMVDERIDELHSKGQERFERIVDLLKAGEALFKLVARTDDTVPALAAWRELADEGPGT